MLYVTGIHALNLPCDLETTGDWHTSALKWESVDIRESSDSIYGLWGIEPEITLPNGQIYPHADHLRAILDIIETGSEYDLRWLRGFRNDFICSDKYNETFFSQVWLLRHLQKWNLIDDLVAREFKIEWFRWKNQRRRIPATSIDIVRRQLPQDVIVRFIDYLNASSGAFALKGATALRLYYHSKRLPEDIELDGFGNALSEIVSSFCSQNNFTYTDINVSPSITRFLIDYGNVEPLKIEVSVGNINHSDIITLNNIRTYSINRLAIMKLTAYSNHDRLRDLYDIVFIGLHYWDDLDPSVKMMLSETLQYKGLDHFDYIVRTQNDDLIDPNELAGNILKLMNQLGLV